MKEYTCTRCKGKFPSELLIQRTKTQRVCKKCNMEIEGLKELKSYICKIFDVKTVPGNILRQIKRYSEEEGYTYQGMRYTLWYIINMEQMKFTSVTIGLIPEFYEKAKKHQILKTKVAKNAKMEYDKTPNIVKGAGNKPQPKLRNRIDITSL